MGGHQQQPPPLSPPPPEFGANYTKLTKIFVGGLSWQTQKDVLRNHFEKYGDVLEAAVISDKFTGRSKGYGFVTFKEAEAARKACEDTSSVINGRRANCNLAFLGARRPAGKASPPVTPALTPPPPQNTGTYYPTCHLVTGSGIAGGGRFQRSAPIPPTWYYPAGSPPPTACSPILRQLYPGSVVPFYAAACYGYPQCYKEAAHLGFSAKFNHAAAGGNYFPVHYSYHGGIVSSSSMIPIYPQYQFQQRLHYLLPHGLGNPTTQFISPAATGHIGLSHIDAPTTRSLASAETF